MKTLFSLINLIVGLLSLLVGAGIFLGLSRNPSSAALGLVALALAATSLWLVKQSAFSRQGQLACAP